MAGSNPSGVAPYTRRDTGHVDPRMRPTQADYDRYIWLVQFARDRRWDEAAIAAESPFRVADPTMTFTALRSARDLRQAAREMGEDTARSPNGSRGWRRVRRGSGIRRSGPMTPRTCAPGTSQDRFRTRRSCRWWGGLSDDRPRAALTRILDGSEYALPSYDPAGPRFDALRYWRGPVWAVMNFMAASGMAEQGLAAEALRSAATPRG
jgi:hypothetical protein